MIYLRPDIFDPTPSEREIFTVFTLEEKSSVDTRWFSTELNSGNVAKPIADATTIKTIRRVFPDFIKNSIF